MRLSALTDQYKLSVDESYGGGSLFENATLGVAITNSAFSYLTANPVLLKMVGYSSEQLRQLSFLVMCIDADRDECRDHLSELAKGARLQYETETRCLRKDGTTLPVNAYFST